VKDKQAILVLEDGSYYEGLAFGRFGDTYGEVVFTTSMSGYQEVLTDPSCKGQIVLMTYPLIGNYGINDEDFESYNIQVEGIIIKELCDHPSNWRCKKTLRQYMEENNIMGMQQVDTRQITQHIRNFGSMYGVISTDNFNVDELTYSAKKFGSIKRDLVDMVSTKEIRHIAGNGYRIVVMDMGVKENSVRLLAKRDCDIYVVPCHATANEILSLKPDGILISNGPGNPQNVPYAVETIRGLIGKKPIMAICLGHQLLGLALGGQTYKLKFGHHGCNHPVKNCKTNRVYITTQHHNYALRDDFCKQAIITHININDNTIEGFTHNEYPIISVQYHPEAGPGPHDSMYMFDEFIDMIAKAS